MKKIIIQRSDIKYLGIVLVKKLNYNYKKEKKKRKKNKYEKHSAILKIVSFNISKS